MTAKNRCKHYAAMLLIAALILLVFWFNWSQTALPNEDAVALDELSPVAQQTYRLIGQGGPFPFVKDGTVFYNFSQILPPKAKGYYREYTVAKKGRRRGAKRIVCGGYNLRQPDKCYYSPDHYRSFRQIVP